MIDEAGFKRFMNRAIGTYNWSYVTKVLSSRFEVLLMGSNCGRLIVIKTLDGSIFVVRDAAHNCYDFYYIEAADVEEIAKSLMKKD